MEIFRVKIRQSFLGNPRFTKREGHRMLHTDSRSAGLEQASLSAKTSCLKVCVLPVDIAVFVSGQIRVVRIYDNEVHIH